MEKKFIWEKYVFLVLWQDPCFVQQNFWVGDRKDVAIIHINIHINLSQIRWLPCYNSSDRNKKFVRHMYFNMSLILYLINLHFQKCLWHYITCIGDLNCVLCWPEWSKLLKLLWKEHPLIFCCHGLFQKNLRCKPTFREAGVRNYREVCMTHVL